MRFVYSVLVVTLSLHLTAAAQQIGCRSQVEQPYVALQDAAVGLAEPRDRFASRHHVENIVPVVEAAMREAGAGFAVVADEVRNLAQRAAAAAKNTASLIEETIRKIKDGTGLVERPNADFRDVSASVRKVTELVGEISAASAEQSRGISGVSGAVGQMDKVTQRNAANAEEIAASAEELSAQALSLQEIVRTLQTIGWHHAEPVLPEKLWAGDLALLTEDIERELPPLQPSGTVSSIVIGRIEQIFFTRVPPAV